MIFALTLTIIAIASGTVLTYTYDEGAPPASRLCSGACLGFAALSLIGFIFASALNLTPIVLFLAAAASASPLILLRQPNYREQIQSDLAAATRGVRRAILKPTWRTTAYVLFYALTGLLLWLVFDRAMYERADGIYTGFTNNLGDLPFHLQVITSFAYGQNFPPEHPVFAGTGFAYPYLADFLAAMFVCAGASLRDSMLIENMVLAIAFVGVLHRWVLELTRDRVAALISPVLVLLSGGVGWWLLFKDTRDSERGILSIIKELPHDYTIMGNTAYRWGNALTTLLVPQRSILFGLPLAIIIFTQWWISLKNNEESKSKKVKGKREAEEGKRQKAKGKREETKNKSETMETATSAPFPFSFFLLPSAKRMLAAGAMAGTLPLVHAHSFVVVMGVGACLALIFKGWRAWISFFVVALLIAVPEMWWAAHGSSASAQSFLGWHFGWDREGRNVFWFWFKNTGLFIPLIIAAILWRDKEYLVPRRLLLFYLPFTLCFFIPNLIKLAPWVWDNIKVLFYWYVASVPLVALVLARLWRSGRALRAVGAMLFASLTLAGSLDVWRVVSRTTEHREFDRNGVRFAEIIRQHTPPRALVLHAPTYNPVVFLTGRRSLLGYPGHIWSQGLDYVPRETDIKKIYAGAPDAQVLLARYGIDYVVVSPMERSYMPVNEAFFARYPKIGEVGEYRLYKIARP